MNLWEIQDLVLEEYKKNGYWDNWKKAESQNKEITDIAELGLIATEIGEAIEAVRDGDERELGFELADIVIRTLNMANRKGIDIESHILAKNKKNLKREKMHGRLKV